jgi:hypothetical protein
VCLTKLDQGVCQRRAFETARSMVTLSSEKTDGLLRLKLLRCYTLEEQKPAVRNRRRWLLSRTVLLQYDIARPHVAVATTDTFRNFKVRSSAASTLQSLPPTLLLSYIKGHCVTVGLAVMKEAVNTWVWEHPKAFFYSGVRTLVDDFKKCV